MFYGYGILNNHVPTLRATVMGSSTTLTDAQKFIAAASITDTTQKNAITQLVADLKTYGIWTKMKAIYPFVGGTAAQHRFNLKDPRTVNDAFYLDFLGGGTHSVTGYKGNGSNGYANTFLTPSTTLTTNNIHYSYYNRTNVSELRYDIGAYQSSPLGSFYGALSWYDASLNRFFLSVNSNEQNVVNADARKFFIANKTTVGSASAFINTTKTSLTVTDRSLPSIPMFINTMNLNGTADYGSGKECAFASIGDGLTDTEAANLYTAVQAYQTTLSRNV